MKARQKSRDNWKLLNKEQWLSRVRAGLAARWRAHHTTASASGEHGCAVLPPTVLKFCFPPVISFWYFYNQGAELLFSRTHPWQEGDLSSSDERTIKLTLARMRSAVGLGLVFFFPRLTHLNCRKTFWVPLMSLWDSWALQTDCRKSISWGSRDAKGWKQLSPGHERVCNQEWYWPQSQRQAPGS